MKFFSEVLLDGGPAFGVLQLNWERVEWGSIAIVTEVLERHVQEGKNDSLHNALRRFTV